MHNCCDAGEVAMFTLINATFLCFKQLSTVADLEIFRGGLSFTKMPAKLEVKTKKKGLHQLFESSFSSSSKFTL